MFLKDILTTSYKSVNDELFLFWLRCVAPKENKRTNIVYQLATIAAPATDELFTSRKHRATERGVQRSKEKHNVTAAAATTTAAIGTADEITPTYANKVDNIMEMVLSILLAMAPQSLDKLQATTTTSTTTTTTTAAAAAASAEIVYEPWFELLLKQCYLLSHIDSKQRAGFMSCGVASHAVADDNDAYFAAVLDLQSSEQEHIDVDLSSAKVVSLTDLRNLVLWRIQGLLTRQAVTGALVNCIEYSTDTNAMLGQLAINRQLAACAEARIGAIHEQSDASYKDLLALFAVYSEKLASQFMLRKSEFPLDYKKSVKATNKENDAFVSQLAPLIAEFNSVDQVALLKLFNNSRQEKTKPTTKRSKSLKHGDEKNNVDDNGGSGGGGGDDDDDDASNTTATTTLTTVATIESGRSSDQQQPVVSAAPVTPATFMCRALMTDDNDNDGQLDPVFHGLDAIDDYLHVNRYHHHQHHQHHHLQPLQQEQQHHNIYQIAMSPMFMPQQQQQQQQEQQTQPPQLGSPILTAAPPSNPALVLPCQECAQSLLLLALKDQTIATQSAEILALRAQLDDANRQLLVMSCPVATEPTIPRRAMLK